jgi:hypothetical protein
LFNGELRNRIIGLKHIIAAHSITDKGPVYDEWHYFDLAKRLLEGRCAKLMSALSTGETFNFNFGMPKFYFNRLDIKDGFDDDIINGTMHVRGAGYLFPAINVVVEIKNRDMEPPKNFMCGDKNFEFTPKGITDFFSVMNPRYNTDFRDGLRAPNAVETVFFGDQSRDREDLMMGRLRNRKKNQKSPSILQPVETGDEQMMGKATQPTIGLDIHI